MPLNGNNFKCFLCDNERAMRVIHRHRLQTIYKCDQCKMMYALPCSTLDKVSFNKAEYDNLKSHRSYKLMDEQKKMDNIQKFLKKGLNKSKLLDIGIGIGTLAEICDKSRIDYTGIEPCLDAYHYCTTILPGLKNRILNESLGNVNLKKNNFDLIIASHVLEHADNPFTFLSLCKDYLSQDGILYLSVPNESHIAFRIMLKKLLGLYSGAPTNIDHKTLFVSKTLKKILTKAGFKNFRIRQKTLWGNQNLLKIAYGAKKIPLFIQMLSFFFRLTKLDLLLGQGSLEAIAFKNKR